MNIEELSAQLRDDLSTNASQGDMLRAVRQFIMDADRDPDRSLEGRFEPTGSCKWDALVAGVADDVAFRHRRRRPEWTSAQELYLDQWWFVTRYPGLHPVAMAETPAAVANHGVFIRRDSLRNV